jgi:hypothetical protein
MNKDVKWPSLCVGSCDTYGRYQHLWRNQNKERKGGRERELRLRMFENRVLKRKFGLKRDEIVGWWRTLHNEELRNLRSAPNTDRRRMRWVGHTAYMEI